MKDLFNLKFEVKCADGVPRIWIQAETGLKERFRFISFIMSLESFEKFSKNSWSYHEEDCYYHLASSGDRVTFYNLELPVHQRAGELNVPFISVNFPMFARRIILRAAKRIVKTGKNDTIQVHPLKLARWEKLYSRQSGMVMTLSSTDTFARVQKLERSGSNFLEKLEYLKKIAKNSTSTFWETAKLHLSTDSDGFFWVARNPRGQEILHGGLYERDGEWHVAT
jgi:hypothetical protein